MEPAHEEILEPTGHCTASAPSAGDVVASHRHGTAFRVGAVMPEGTGCRLASHGLDPRGSVPSLEHGVESWSRPEPEEGPALPAPSKLTPTLS